LIGSDALIVILIESGRAENWRLVILIEGDSLVIVQPDIRRVRIYA